MNTSLVVCAFFMTGWISQDATEPLAPSPQNLQTAPAQTPAARPAPRHASSRGARTVSAGGMQRSRMPLSPTDPRTLGDADIPLPPTMDNAAPMPVAHIFDPRARYVPVASGEGEGRRFLDEKPREHFNAQHTGSPYFLVYGNTGGGVSSNRNAYIPPAASENGTNGIPIEKPFDHYNPAPAMSPYLLLNSNTANGTISTYNAYVRPALRNRPAKTATCPRAARPLPATPQFLDPGTIQSGRCHWTIAATFPSA